MSPRRNPKIQMKKCAGCGHYVKDGWTNTYLGLTDPMCWRCHCDAAEEKVKQ